MRRPVVICVDFDGTIHDNKHPIAGRRMGPPVDGALAAIAVLAGRFTVIILTANRPGQWIHDWLRFYGFPDLEVTNVKPMAAAYIDDKGIRFTSWTDALYQLEGVLS